VNCYLILSKVTHWYDRIRGLILVQANFGVIISIEKVYSGVCKYMNWDLTAEWSAAKSVPDEVLVWRLAAGFNPPGDSNRTRSLHGVRRLAMRCIPPGGSNSISGVLKRWHLAVGADPPGGGCYVCMFWGA